MKQNADLCLQAGGCISLVRSSVAILSSTFKNSKGANGGAINIEMSQASTKECGFESNTATDSGGALFLAGSVLSSLDDTYNNNQAFTPSSIVHSL